MIRLSETLAGTHLNSVWLEGTVLAEPVELADASDDPGIRFRIAAHDSAIPGSPSEFLVEARGSAVDGNRSSLNRGNGVRIIGRLAQHRWRDPAGVLRKEVKIVGEWIEPFGLRR